MNIKLLEEFLVLADCLNFSTAAKKLYTTQPALSRHLKSLEKELSVKLLYRDSHHVELTREGETLVSEAKNVLKAYKALEDNVTKKSTLRIVGTVEQYPLSEILADTCHSFRQDNPYTEIEIKDLMMGDFRDLLLYDDADIAFSGDYQNMMSNELSYFPLYSIPLVVWVSTEHRLAQRKAVSFHELECDYWKTVNPTGEIKGWQFYIEELFSEKEA